MSAADEPGVKINLNTIYQAQLSQNADLAEIKGSLSLLTLTAGHQGEALADHELRLRTVEANMVTKKSVINTTTVTTLIVTLGLAALGFLITIGDRLWA